MSAKIEYSFSTRRDAELAVERLVQEHGFERTDIFIQPQGSDNSVGEEISGSDAAAPRLASATRVADPPCGQLLARDILRMIGGAIDGCA